jgi:hypothetical protein
MLTNCSVAICQLADCSAALVKKGRLKSGAAGQILADFEQKGPKSGRTYKKLFLFSYPL